MWRTLSHALTSVRSHVRSSAIATGRPAVNVPVVRGSMRGDTLVQLCVFCALYLLLTIPARRGRRRAARPTAHALRRPRRIRRIVLLMLDSAPRSGTPSSPSSRRRRPPPARARAHSQTRLSLPVRPPRSPQMPRMPFLAGALLAASGFLAISMCTAVGVAESMRMCWSGSRSPTVQRYLVRSTPISLSDPNLRSSSLCLSARAFTSVSAASIVWRSACACSESLAVRICSSRSESSVSACRASASATSCSWCERSCRQRRLIARSCCSTIAVSCCSRSRVRLAIASSCIACSCWLVE
mmetsp:Transcript_47406/g.131815  ORF Transcript_47406/g.131815 Transcript_47406/m.131815 type:complete len:298 (+) Transcript_47406:122-1015(+)